MNVKDRKFSVYFLPKLWLDSLHQVFEYCDLQSRRSKNLLDAGFSEVHLVGCLGLTLEMCHIAQKFQIVQVREKEP